MILANSLSYKKGFTIVELLIVVVVIAILAAITIVAYNGITSRAKESAVKSNLDQAVKKLETYKTLQGAGTAYPSSYTAAGLVEPAGTTYTYLGGSTSYCLQATNGTLTYYISSTATSPSTTSCLPSAIAMQTVTNASCSTSRTLAYDVRDNRTYWIQKLADGQCWMLTNLAYAGGGTNTYSDTRTLSNGSSDSATVYSPAKYYVSAYANQTTNPALPSSVAPTDIGATTGLQYGYHYNWCAAMGGQTSTSACTSNTTPAPNTTISVCPAGWRLPTGQPTTGQFTALNNAINGGLDYEDTGLVATWLAQRGGGWWGGWNQQGVSSFGHYYYWSSTQIDGTNARVLALNSGYVEPSGYGFKSYGYNVRCIAA